jgi:hypothetical protein
MSSKGILTEEPLAGGHIAHWSWNSTRLKDRTTRLLMETVAAICFCSISSSARHLDPHSPLIQLPAWAEIVNLPQQAVVFGRVRHQLICTFLLCLPLFIT